MKLPTRAPQETENSLQNRRCSLRRSKSVCSRVMHTNVDDTIAPVHRFSRKWDLDKVLRCTSSSVVAAHRSHSAIGDTHLFAISRPLVGG